MKSQISSYLIYYRTLHLAIIGAIIGGYNWLCVLSNFKNLEPESGQVKTPLFSIVVKTGFHDSNGKP